MHDEDSGTGLDTARRNLVKALGVIAAAGAATIARPARAVSLCFLAGTRIRTRDGDRAIETLSEGDEVLTASGAFRPIQWIARSRYERADRAKPWVRDVLPVRIRRSAIADNAPSADLLVSRAHALFIDGLLIPAGDLVNGETIVIDAAAHLTVIEYFHLKLESHDIILAQGAPCETLRAVSENAANFAEHLRRFGDAEDAPCAPVVGYNGGRAQLASRLRSAASPLIDWRTPFDLVRDRLERRALALSA
jgi:hypothetical protein